MNIRQRQEEWENEHLSVYATKSYQSKGRDVLETACDIRTEFQRDRDRILHCKSFRRLKHKTQVFLAPEGDHYRTRLTHTLEVAQIGRTIARALKLNEDLTEAIALGHDLGHTPFGHAGEAVLNEICPLGFVHSEHSVRVVEVLEKNGKGLNLTKEVRDGILNHRTVGIPSTLEGKVIRYADKIAYINHDIDDAIRGGILTVASLPSEEIDILGHSTRERLNTMIHDIVTNSYDKPDICMSQNVGNAMTSLRKFMFKSVYTNDMAKQEEQKAAKMIREMYEYFINNFEAIPEAFRSEEYVNSYTKERIVCDYIAGMSDQYAVSVFKKIFIPVSWK